MRQILFEIPILGLPIFGYGLMLFVAFMAGNFVCQRLSRREGVDPEKMLDLALWMFIGGIIGARVLYFIYFQDRWDGLLDFFKIWEGGLVLEGAVVAATITVLVGLRIKRLPVMKVVDIAAPPIAIGLGFGRLGCFLNGCCWGRLTDQPWGIRFPKGSVPWRDQIADGLINESDVCLPLHPTQIYLAAAGFVMFAATMWYFNRRRYEGQVMVMLMIGYSVSRFVIEYYRIDVDRWSNNLTSSQNICIGILIAAIVFWAFIRWRDQPRVTTQRSGPPMSDAEPSTT